MPSPAVSPAPSPWLLVGFVVAALLVVAIFAVPLWVMEARAPVRSREERAVDLARDQRFFEGVCDEVGLFVEDAQGKRTYPRRFEIEPKHRGGRTIRPAWGEFGVEQPRGWSREEMELALQRLVDSIGSEHVDAEFYLVGTGTWCVRLDSNDGSGEMYDD